ncbi:MAG: metal-dependent hydrolase [Myxococcota bacterium]|nr:metal-dependent hydrolase [Myxococcota bacterium]
MASLGHVAVGAAAARMWCGADARPRERIAATIGFAALSLAPDLDVIAFALRIPYEAPFGHRGATHALATALVLGVTVGLAFRNRRHLAFWATLVLMSHGLLDTLTDGGLGVALLWPFDTARYFAPVRPLPVAPIGVGMLSARGLFVTIVELIAFLPFWLVALWPRRPLLRQ